MILKEGLVWFALEGLEKQERVRSLGLDLMVVGRMVGSEFTKVWVEVELGRIRVKIGEGAERFKAG